MEKIISTLIDNFKKNLRLSEDFSKLKVRTYCLILVRFCRSPFNFDGLVYMLSVPNGSNAVPLSPHRLKSRYPVNYTCLKSVQKKKSPPPQNLLFYDLTNCFPVFWAIGPLKWIPGINGFVILTKIRKALTSVYSEWILTQLTIGLLAFQINLLKIVLTSLRKLLLKWRGIAEMIKVSLDNTLMYCMSLWPHNKIGRDFHTQVPFSIQEFYLQKTNFTLWYYFLYISKGLNTSSTTACDKSWCIQGLYCS